MKPCFFATLSLISIPLLPAATLVDDHFDHPSEITYQYPPSPGQTPNFHGNFSGWSQKGKISVTYGAALGVNGSGGLLCTVDEPSPAYMVAQYVKVTLPITDPAYTTAEQLKGYTLEFDACIPKDRVLSVYLNPVGAEGMQGRQWGSRLVLNRVTGTGEYKHYSLPASAVAPHVLGSFLQFIRDASLNGLEKIQVDIVWLVPNNDQAWAPGESFQLDNIKLTSAP